MATRFDELGSAYLAGPMTDLFGETAVYRPYGASARTIQVAINRDVQQEANAAPVVLVEARLDATLGVTMDELDRGQDVIELPMERPGGPTTRRKIANYSDSVGGFVTLEVH